MKEKKDTKLTIQNFRFAVASLIGNSIAFCLKRLLGRSATAFPGKMIFTFYPDYFSTVRNFCKKSIINITGTNGKTTTSGILANILKEANFSVLHNQEGANMPTGIATAIAEGTGLGNKTDYFVLETDEAYLPKLYDKLNSDYLLVTNLFRDQLDRYGEINTTAEKIKSAIEKNPNLSVFLNADDPTLLVLNLNKNTKFYGFNSIEYKYDTKTNSQPTEVVKCSCGNEFEYHKHFYSHIGHFSCKCSNGRKVPEYGAVAEIYQNYSIIKIKKDEKELIFTTHQPNLYNAYNALAAISLALELGVNEHKIQKGLDSYKAVFGRAETKKIQGKKVFIQLIKNPTGANEVLKTVAAETEQSCLFIALNDHFADGRDVSWLWDTNFELLKNYKGQIYLSGRKAHEVAIRLRYTDFDMSQIEILNQAPSLAFQIVLTKTPDDTKILVLPSYTALLELNKKF